MDPILEKDQPALDYSLVERISKLGSVSDVGDVFSKVVVFWKNLHNLILTFETCKNN